MALACMLDMRILPGLYSISAAKAGGARSMRRARELADSEGPNHSLAAHLPGSHHASGKCGLLLRWKHRGCGPHSAYGSRMCRPASGSAPKLAVCCGCLL
eukprot:118310-Chlamydomonas_euryale.AAC.6